MQLAHYLGLLERAERDLADALRMVADGHADEPDVTSACRMLAAWSDRHAEELQPFAARYGEQEDSEPDRLHNDLFGDGVRSGPGLPTRSGSSSRFAGQARRSPVP